MAEERSILEVVGKFSIEMYELLTTDPAHADLFNERYKQLLNNCLYFKNMLGDSVLETNEKNIIAAVNEVNNSCVSHILNHDNPHGVSKEQLCIEYVDNTRDEDKIVSVPQREAIDQAYQQATGYTDKKIADLIGGAPSTLDTLAEIAAAMNESEDVVTALHESIGSKAAQAELDGHINNSTIHVTANEKAKWDAKISSGSQAKLYNVGLGNSDTALIYSEGDDVSFRFKGKNGDTLYTNLKNITDDIAVLADRGRGYFEICSLWSSNNNATLTKPVDNILSYSSLLFCFIYGDKFYDTKLIPARLFTQVMKFTGALRLHKANGEDVAAEVWWDGSQICTYINTGSHVVRVYGIA